MTRVNQAARRTTIRPVASSATLCAEPTRAPQQQNPDALPTPPSHQIVFLHGRLDQFFRNTRKDIRWIDQILRATGRKVERQMLPRHLLIGSGQRVGIGIERL
jgi:hypothetical protein